MGVVEQELCDGCGALISGKKGVVYQRNPALLITGQISVMEVDPDSKWREHIYITPGPETKLSLCNMDCLQIYVDAHLVIAKSRMAEKLRREAAGEHSTRMQKDMDYQPRQSFKVGNKPGYH